jgi:hypothetical protein
LILFDFFLAAAQWSTSTVRDSLNQHFLAATLVTVHQTPLHGVMKTEQLHTTIAAVVMYVSLWNWSSHCMWHFCVSCGISRQPIKWVAVAPSPITWWALSPQLHCDVLLSYRPTTSYMWAMSELQYDI